MLRSLLTRLCVVGVGALVVMLSVVGFSPANAASCYNGTCRGLDPESSGCNVPSAGVYTLDNFTDGRFYVELRYSPLCQAVWTRITATSGTPGHYCNLQFAQTVTYTWEGRFAYQTGTQANCSGTRRAWTAMSPFDGVLVKACVNHVWATATPEICTAAH